MPAHGAAEAGDGAPLLELRHLSVSYAGRGGDLPAVVDFSLQLRRGESHGLVGESGCGKSTVALAIMRYLGQAGRVVSGSIFFKGRDLLRMGSEEVRKIRGAAIAMVYQEPMASLNPCMRIGDQLLEVPMYHDGVGRQEAQALARRMLDLVRLADGPRLLRAYPHQLSGGQQQRIVIAMALLSNPALLLLDEPTTALDVTVEAGIVDLIREISIEFGTSMLYISHNLGLVRETCDRITVMYCGQPVEVGEVATVFRRMRHPYTQGLFAAIPALTTNKDQQPLTAIAGQMPSPGLREPGCLFAPRCGFSVPGRCTVGEIPLAAVDAAGHTSRCLRAAEIDWEAGKVGVARRAGGEIGDVLLAATDLSKRYGPVSVNEKLSFEVRRGETLAVVGESGCGKSTLARILMGLTPATAGSVTLAGEELANVPVTRRRRRTIRSLQMIFQNPFDTLNPSHTVARQIARVIRKFGVERDAARIDARVLELLDLVKLPRRFAHFRPRQLSGGQKQRVGLARAFAGHPAVVVADEPVSALDVSVQAAVTELLIDMQRREGTTLLFISHDLLVVRYLADRILVMYLGQIMEQGTAAEVFTPPYHPYTEALLAAVPVADQRIAKRKVRLSGEMPSASHPPPGCRFSTRCGYRMPGTCDRLAPPERVFSATHRVFCHLPMAQLLAMLPVFVRAPETNFHPEENP